MTSSYSAHSPAPQSQAWHTYPLDDILLRLDTQPDLGLADPEIAQRQRFYGKNEIEEESGRHSWEILLDQFKNVMLLMLIAVALVSGILDVMTLQQQGFKAGELPFKDTIAILLIVILNGLLGYFQESRAEKALAALKRLSSPKVHVLRHGKRQEIKAPELVPGDMVLIEAGTQVCADGCLIEASNLYIRESALTGEAHLIHKYPIAEGMAEDTPLGDRRHCVYTGTEVIHGRAKFVVTSIGMETELGKIATLLQEVEYSPTPLQQRMTHLGNILVTGSMILVAIVIGGGVLYAGWGKLQELVEISLSMAVAVVPEGLPAVITVSLALGTQRMVKRHALIRKLPAVETLGSVNVICSDKTGTLTQNKMVVQEIATLDQHFKVTGEGYQPKGEFKRIQYHHNAESPINPQDHAELKQLLWTCALCNDAQLQHHEQEWQILGDPTEGALLALAGKDGLNAEDLRKHWRRMGEIPFSSERKRMSVIIASQEDNLSQFSLFTKGSAELILDRCQFYQAGTQQHPLTPEQKTAILAGNEGMASRGLRILGFAYKNLSDWSEDLTESELESNLIWLGTVGMMDAPRLEVKTAVDKCREAGIRVIMITGDHPLTANVIAYQLGIAQVGDEILTGRELETLSQQALEAEVERISVYARVSPEHKLRIVQALQKKGKFVAMTGDGVNDAPALKQANIGIAMGITGTDVSKEASDMILLDDNFTSIVAATEEGRVVYSNIRYFIKYILGSNIGEVITIAAAPLLGLSGVPLTPLQILWMNLVTDGLPALALAMEPAAPNIMRRPPVDPTESIFARGLGAYIVRIGLIFATITISLMLWAYGEAQSSGNLNSWKTMVFTTLCIAQMGHAIAVRSPTLLTIEMNPFTNLYLWGAVIVTTILQLMLIYVAPLRHFFDTEWLTGQQLLICLGFSSLIFLWVELEKLIIRFYCS